MTVTIDEAQSLYDRTFDLIFEMKSNPSFDEHRRLLQTRLTEVRNTLNQLLEEEYQKKAEYREAVWREAHTKKLEHLSKLAALRPVLTKKETKQRNMSMVADRAAGITFLEISKKHCISPARVMQIVNAENRRQSTAQKKYHDEHRGGKVIDMGGARDITHVWTPEMQAKEFGLI